jgi:DHA1 family tetracycline resistance protein-like MFS transporter
MTRPVRRAVPIVLAVAAVDVIGFGIVMPVLPALIVQLGGVGTTEAVRIGGWMLAVFAAAQFLAGPLLGNLGDRFGRRQVILACTAAFALDYLLMAAAPTLAWLFVGRAVAGVTGAIYGPAGAVIADVTPPERRAASFGYLGAAFGLGFIVGPALGGLVAGFGLRAPFFVAAGLAGLNTLAVLFLLPETLDADRRRPFRWRDANLVAAFRPLRASGAAGPLLVAWFLWQVGSTVYPATWSFWATIRLGWDARAIGLSLAWVGLLSLLVQWLVTGRAVARLGERGAAVLGLSGAAACLVGYGFADRGWQVYAFFLVGAVGALAWPAMNGLLSRMVDETRQGALQGGLGAINAVAAVIGPLLATEALARGSARGMPGAAFLVSGALLFLAALVIWAWRPAAPSSPDPAGG